jgi:hygromycin-B 7''-O-kinase
LARRPVALAAGGDRYRPQSLKRRLMALMLLHRASDPVSHICIEGWQQRADDLVALQELIWPD